MKRVSLLLSSALALCLHQTQGTAVDCSKGCELSYDLVCGGDGLTYMGSCLAICAGTTIVDQGPCMPAGGTEKGEKTSRKLAEDVDLHEHGIAALLDLPDTTVRRLQGLSPQRAVTATDINRFASQGLQLVGAPRLLQPKTDGHESFNGTARTNPLDERTFLRTLDTNLMYVSTDEHGRQRRLQEEHLDMQAEASDADGGDPLRDLEETEVADELEGLMPRSNSTRKARRRQQVTTSQWNTMMYPSQFNVVTPMVGYRLATMGLLGGFSTCSGTVIGPNAVLSAAHCFIEWEPRNVRNAMGWSQNLEYFTPGHYYDKTKTQRSAYGKEWNIVAVAIKPGYKDFVDRQNLLNSGDRRLDVAVVIVEQTAPTLSQTVKGARAIVSQPTGFAGNTPLYYGGYPGDAAAQTQKGNFIFLRAACTKPQNVAKATDTNFVIKGCPRVWGGMSGGPLWDQRGVIRGVLRGFYVDSQGKINKQWSLWSALSAANIAHVRAWAGASITTACKVEASGNDKKDNAWTAMWKC